MHGESAHGFSFVLVSVLDAPDSKSGWERRSRFLRVSGSTPWDGAALDDDCN
jgi:hypothetical protein